MNLKKPKDFDNYLMKLKNDETNNITGIITNIKEMETLKSVYNKRNINMEQITERTKNTNIINKLIEDKYERKIYRKDTFFSDYDSFQNIVNCIHLLFFE